MILVGKSIWWPTFVRKPALGVFVCASLAVPVPSSANKSDNIETIARKLVVMESEVVQLKQGIRQPTHPVSTKDQAKRRLIDAQVAFGVGNYDIAAVMLYDFIEKHPGQPDFDKALYYLAEALYQKRDYVAARTYFGKLVSDIGVASSFYQQSLERLLELSLKLRDADANKWLRALDNIPQSKLLPSVPYIRGKYAYFSQNYDTALQEFSRIGKDSKYYTQARYFVGASQVAKGNLKDAASTYRAITKTVAKNPKEKRVIELSYMALGRLHYERDEPSKAVDEYLRISRSSDLFDEALFEVAWVYVKNKQFDKSLRALELLALTDPNSSKLPQVRVLEGNLRIRKAQKLSRTSEGNSVEEYDKAIRVFEDARQTFRRPHDELERLLASKEDAGKFIAQITGRHSDAFAVEQQLPKVAAEWLRKQEEVAQVVQIETDLGAIQKEIAIANKTIARMEEILSTDAGVNAFPSLAEKRVLATELASRLVTLREDLTRHELALVIPHATSRERRQLASLARARLRHRQKLRGLPHGEAMEGRRIEQARKSYTELDQEANKVAVIVETTKATLVALQKYLQEKDPKVLDTNQGFVNEVTQLETELATLQKELTTLRQQATLARDATGTGDDVANRARSIRAQLQEVLEKEHRLARKIVKRMTGNKRSKAQQVVSLLQKADALGASISEVDQNISTIVEQELAEVRTAVQEEKARVAAYAREFHTYERESRTLGGQVLADNFEAIKEKILQHPRTRGHRHH